MNGDNVESDPRVWMQKAKEGDREAFSNLYELYFTPIFRYIYFRTRNRREAEDLTQTIFLKVYRSLPRFQEKGVPPLAYFFAIAKNTLIDFWKKRKDLILDDSREATLPAAAAEEHPEKLVEKMEAAQVVHRALPLLTAEQQEVLVLRFINDVATAEIAGMLGKSEEAVRQLQCRALKKLRSILKDSYGK